MKYRPRVHIPYRIWTHTINFGPLGSIFYGIHILCAIQYGPSIENGNGSIIYRGSFFYVS